MALFSKRKGSKDGLRGTCKKCHSEYRREHYLKNKDKVLKQVNDYRINNPDKYSDKNKKAGRTHEMKCIKCDEIVYVTKKDKLIGKSRYCSRTCKDKDKKSDYYLYLNSVKKRAIKRKFDFDLDEKFLIDLLNSQNFKCAITNNVISVKNKDMKKTLYDTASLDRKDNSKGYTKDNVQWVMLGINYMKLNYTDEELHKTLKLIKENYTPLT